MRRIVLVVVFALVSCVAAKPQAEEAGTLAIQAPKPAAVPPRSSKDIDGAIARGVHFLLQDQNPNGSWGSAERTKGLNIYAPVPGAHHAFRAAVTAMCVSALIEAEGRSDGVAATIDRGEAWLLENLPNVKRASPDALYNVWAHGYALQALAKLHKRHAGDSAKQEPIALLVEDQVEKLTRYEAVAGGWGYYDFDVGAKKPAASSTSFTTAAILVAMAECRDEGFKMPEPLVKRAVKSIERQLKPDFTYLYGEYLKWYPHHPINMIGGSLGRTQSCNCALRLWGVPKITDQVIEATLDRLFARNWWLDIGRKRPIPHESHFAVAGYFYYFGHYYAARCIQILPESERASQQDQLTFQLLKLQEKDGSWWDYPLYNYHQQYGTAFALMSLVGCR